MASQTNDPVLIVSAQTEFDLSQLDSDEDKADMLEVLGATSDATGLTALTRAAYEQLGQCGAVVEVLWACVVPGNAWRLALVRVCVPSFNPVGVSRGLPSVQGC